MKYTTLYICGFAEMYKANILFWQLGMNLQNVGQHDQTFH